MASSRAGEARRGLGTGSGPRRGPLPPLAPQSAPPWSSLLPGCAARLPGAPPPTHGGVCPSRGRLPSPLRVPSSLGRRPTSNPSALPFSRVRVGAAPSLSLLRVMTAPWLAPHRNGGNPLTLGWGTASSQGTSHPAHPGLTSKGPGQPRGKWGAAPGPSSQTSGRASGVICSKGTHARVSTHTGAPGGLRADQDTCDTPLRSAHTAPRHISCVSSAALWLLAPRAHTCTHTHTPPIHTWRAQHTLTGPVL